VPEQPHKIHLPADNRPRFVLRQRVAYIDTDAAQVVHHATYLRYFEVARIEFLRAHGWDYAGWLARERLGLPVAENWVKYRSPARFDDALEVETWVAHGSRASLRFEYHVRRDGLLLTEGYTICPCTTLDGAIRRVPLELLACCLGPRFDEARV
jgi:acyl-CoA thioester hydrolase